ncbi:MAG TPA: 3-hydroxy-3-methylglutaryl-CoA reductase, partial [Candidatus Thermoplasmatota archaeon]|nr:3-hydroxy-3-methylglutaryl-CoA reductase [Candidatus Thermoplasmatota archaeon]
MAPRKSPPTWSGFHRLGRAARLKRVADFAGLTAAERNILEVSSALPMATAERFIENAAGTFPLPLGFAVGFVVD